MFFWTVYNPGAIDGKTEGSVLGANFFCREEMMLGLSLSPKLKWGSNTVSIANTDFKKMGALIHEVFSSWGCCLSSSSYHMALNGILLSYPCCCSLLLLGNLRCVREMGL